MNRDQLVKNFWNDVAGQDAEALRSYFHPNAYVRWNNTNEHFNVDEYITANCEYPGDWRGEVERIEQTGDLVISVTRVWLADNSVSFHATSFFEFSYDKILVLNEYWGDDGEAPGWRLDKHIGTPIK